MKIEYSEKIYEWMAKEYPHLTKSEMIHILINSTITDAYDYAVPFYRKRKIKARAFREFEVPESLVDLFEVSPCIPALKNEEGWIYRIFYEDYVKYL